MTRSKHQLVIDNYKTVKNKLDDLKQFMCEEIGLNTISAIENIDKIEKDIDKYFEDTIMNIMRARDVKL